MTECVPCWGMFSTLTELVGRLVVEVVTPKLKSAPASPAETSGPAFSFKVPRFVGVPRPNLYLTLFMDCIPAHKTTKDVVIPRVLWRF